MHVLERLPIRLGLKNVLDKIWIVEALVVDEHLPWPKTAGMKIKAARIYMRCMRDAARKC